MDVDLSVQIARDSDRPLRLRNPVMTAAGTFGYGLEYGRLLDLTRIGAIVTQSTTVEPRKGGPMPRWVETPSGLLSAASFQNPGIRRVLSSYAPRWAKLGTPVVVGIVGATLDDYVELAALLDEAEHVAGIELNLTGARAGEPTPLGGEPAVAGPITAAVRAATGLPLVVKLSPNVDNLPAVASSVEEAGADALSLVDTITGLVIDTATRRPALGSITGGVSGPAVRPLAVYKVWQVAQVVAVPVIGVGGITCADDALQFIMAGASAVQVGSSSFRRPTTVLEVAEGLAAWMRAHGVTGLDEIRGIALPLRIVPG